MRCFTLRSKNINTTTSPSSPSPSHQQVLEASPTLNLTNEYTNAVQTDSYKVIWEAIQLQQQNQPSSSSSSSSSVVAQVLKPDKSSIQQALGRSKPTNLTRLVSTYFDNSEHTSHLCLLLHRSVDQARSLYAPLCTLLDLLPSSSNQFLTQSQCDWAFDTLFEFARLENPFPDPNSDNFREMRLCFSQLKHQLDLRLHKARTRARLHRRATTGTALCLITTTVGVVVSAVVIATHAVAAFAAAPLFALLPTNFAKKQLHHISQLEAAARGTYVLNHDLDTIDHLVARLHDAVESDKRLIRLGIERGRDRYPIQEVVNQLRKNHPNFVHQLKDLEEHVCLCFAAVNRARSLLLQEIHLHS